LDRSETDIETNLDILYGELYNITRVLTFSKRALRDAFYESEAYLNMGITFCYCEILNFRQKKRASLEIEARKT